MYFNYLSKLLLNHILKYNLLNQNHALTDLILFMIKVGLFFKIIQLSFVMCFKQLYFKNIKYLSIHPKYLFFTVVLVYFIYFTHYLLHII